MLMPPFSDIRLFSMARTISIGYRDFFIEGKLIHSSAIIIRQWVNCVKKNPPCDEFFPPEVDASQGGSAVSLAYHHQHPLMRSPTGEQIVARQQAAV
jgi:hypothetical protein